MKRVLTCIFISAFIFQGCVKSKETEIEAVTVDEMNTHIQYGSLPVTEIKNKDDFKKSHLVNASNVVENEDFRTGLKSLEKDLPIAIYFTSENNTAAAATVLKEIGFEHIYILDGGIKKWNADNQLSK